MNKFSVSARGVFDQNTPCLAFEAATLDHRQGGLKLRVRTYFNGVQTTWGLNGGDVSEAHTSFSKTLNTHADQVCNALVYSTSPNTVAYGPVCINL